MSMMLRRQMMQPSGGDPDLTQITINSEPQKVSECRAAIQTAVNLPGRNFVAFVDDYAYMTGGGSKCMCVVNAFDDNNNSVVYVNDSSGDYGYMRVYAAASSITCVIPAGTVFNVFVYPDS